MTRLDQRVTLADRPRARYGERIALVGAAILLLLCCDPIQAGQQCPGEGCTYVRPVDQIFLVSTRGVGCTTDINRLASGVRAKRLDIISDQSGCRHGRHWQDLSIEELAASVDPTTPTIILCHGNRVEPNEVRSRGLWAYGKLMQCRQDDRPVQFIIFSWPSSEIKGILKDVRTKAARTRPVAKQMAWFIDQLPTEAPLGLLGYSFGARVMSGATHLLAGGSMNGMALNERRTVLSQPTQPRRINAVFLAAALHADWLGPGRYNGYALQSIDRLLVTTNRHDPAMRFYSIISRKTQIKPVGLAGPTCLSRQYASQTRLFDVSSFVGTSHSMCKYMACRSLMAKSWRYLTFADSDLHLVASTKGSQSDNLAAAR